MKSRPITVLKFKEYNDYLLWKRNRAKNLAKIREKYPISDFALFIEKSSSCYRVLRLRPRIDKEEYES